MIIKNVSGETRYFGFGQGVRGRIMANNATSTIPDDNPVALGQVRRYVDQGVLQITEGPADAALVASANTPAFGYILLTGAAADNDTVTIAGVVFEFENDAESLSDPAYVWAGDGAAAGTAAGTLRTAINTQTDVTGVIADAAVQYDTGLYIIPLRRADGADEAGTYALAKSGTNITVSGAALVAGVTGLALKTVIKKIVPAAGDATNAVLLVATGLTSITTVHVDVRTAAGIEKAWNGTALISGGNVVLTNVGDVDWVATDIVTVTARGA